MRAVHALTNGQLATAVDHNVVTVALLPVLAAAWIVCRVWWIATGEVRLADDHAAAAGSLAPGIRAALEGGR